VRHAAPALAVAIVVLADAFVLAGAGWNRHGEPEASLVLTERELPLAYTWKENSGIWLQLAWSGGGSRWYGGYSDPDERSWDTEAKIRELGFDSHVPANDPSAEVFYEKTRSLERYAVLEYEGDSWRRWLAGEERRIEDLAREDGHDADRNRKLEEMKASLTNAIVARSRLTLVDVGRDAAELRQNYPERSRYLIAQAVVTLRLQRNWNAALARPGEASLRLVVEKVLSDEIQVPLAERPILDTIRRENLTKTASTGGWGTRRTDAPPRYEVRLVYGRRLEPWIAGIRGLDADVAPPR
jgi:hypothetical protein